MRIRMNAPLFVIGKPTQQGKKDPSQTYYFVTASQGEEDAGRIRVADADTYNRIVKYRQQLFTFEFNDQYNSFVIVGVEPPEDSADKGTAESTATSANAGAPPTGTATAGTPSADTTTGKPDKPDKK